jgi:hypothetical protein
LANVQILFFYVLLAFFLIFKVSVHHFGMRCAFQPTRERRAMDFGAVGIAAGRSSPYLPAA